MKHSNISICNLNKKWLAKIEILVKEWGVFSGDGKVENECRDLFENSQHVLSGSAVHKPFDVATVCQTECMITTFQNAYFYSESFEEAKEKLRWDLEFEKNHSILVNVNTHGGYSTPGIFATCHMNVCRFPLELALMDNLIIKNLG